MVTWDVETEARFVEKIPAMLDVMAGQAVRELSVFSCDTDVRTASKNHLFK
jgi:hypothetical protein